MGILGVERTARIANFREIDWESMGFNYSAGVQPNALPMRRTTLPPPSTCPKAPTARPGALLRGLVKDLAVKLGDRGRRHSGRSAQHPRSGEPGDRWPQRR
jgi:hypothetical protein